MTAQTTLVLGANTVIAQSNCSVAFATTNQLKFGEQLGLLWLPLDEHRKAACSPAYLHEPKEWAQLNSKDNPNAWQLDLPALFDKQGVSFLQLIAYVYHEPSLNLPAVELSKVNLTLNNGDIRYEFIASERHVKAAIILEIYRRNGQFKCRALGESSTQGLASLEHMCKLASICVRQIRTPLSKMLNVRSRIILTVIRAHQDTFSLVKLGQGRLLLLTLIIY